MFTATAVHTAIYLYRLSIAVLLFALCPDMTQLSFVMADVIMHILKDGICHVGILPDVFFVCLCLPLPMVLKFNKTSNPVLLQIQVVQLRS